MIATFLLYKLFQKASCGYENYFGGFFSLSRKVRTLEKMTSDRKERPKKNSDAAFSKILYLLIVFIEDFSLQQGSIRLNIHQCDPVPLRGNLTKTPSIKQHFAKAIFYWTKNFLQSYCILSSTKHILFFLSCTTLRW